MKIIAGLGNPEKDYKGTRHNVGFETVNKLAYDHDIKINKAKFRGHIGEGIIAGEKALLLKPQTYMNLSGECVRDVISFYKLSPDDLIVVYDDTSIDAGEIRVRERGSAAGHNGMKNIIYQLETDEFVRIRIGIGDKPPGWELADYVLSKVGKNEMETLIAGITKASEAIETVIKEGTAAAMNKYNVKNRGAGD